MNVAAVNPYSLVLDSTPWTVFLTGTLASEETSPRKVRLAWWAFLETLAVAFDGDRRNTSKGLTYFVRIEPGEEGGRWHLHALIFFPNRTVTRKLCFAIKTCWEKTPGNGIGRTREVTERPGSSQGSRSILSDYLTKLEENRYESSKFPGAEMFIFSPDLLPPKSGLHDRDSAR